MELATESSHGLAARCPILDFGPALLAPNLCAWMKGMRDSIPNTPHPASPPRKGGKNRPTPGGQRVAPAARITPYMPVVVEMVQWSEKFNLCNKQQDIAPDLKSQAVCRLPVGLRGCGALALALRAAGRLLNFFSSDDAAVDLLPL